MEVAAHDTYVNVMNSNELETLMSVMTDNVVYPSPGKPDTAGDVAVRAWAAAYFASSRTHWTKTSVGFTRAGDRPFERYHYGATDTDRKPGAVSHDTDKRLNVFHRGSDGRWRVAVDGWRSDRLTGP